MLKNLMEEGLLSNYKKARDTIKGSWEKLFTFFYFDETLKNKLYTTNPIETIFFLLKPVSKNARAMMSKDNVIFLFKVISLTYGNEKT
jgi:transposase-like protein